jgi:hypothetical protein
MVAAIVGVAKPFSRREGRRRSCRDGYTMLSKARRGHKCMYLFSIKLLGGSCDAMGADAGSPGFSAVECTGVRWAAWGIMGVGAASLLIGVPSCSAL